MDTINSQFSDLHKQAYTFTLLTYKITYNFCYSSVFLLSNNIEVILQVFPHEYQFVSFWWWQFWYWLWVSYVHRAKFLSKCGSKLLQTARKMDESTWIQFPTPTVMLWASSGKYNLHQLCGDVWGYVPCSTRSFDRVLLSLLYICCCVFVNAIYTYILDTDKT